MQLKQFDKQKWIGITVLLLGCFLFITGILRGEPLLILKKAAAICLECIGIG